VVENVLTQVHIHLAARRSFLMQKLDCILTKKKYFTGERVTWQEITLTGTIRNQRYKQKHLKNNMSIWPAMLSVKGASKLMS